MEDKNKPRAKEPERSFPSYSSLSKASDRASVMGDTGGYVAPVSRAADNFTAGDDWSYMRDELASDYGRLANLREDLASSNRPRPYVVGDNTAEIQHDYSSAPGEYYYTTYEPVTSYADDYDVDDYYVNPDIKRKISESRGELEEYDEMLNQRYTQYTTEKALPRRATIRTSMLQVGLECCKPSSVLVPSVSASHGVMCSDTV